MTEYNGEQNNIIGTAQPTEVHPEVYAEPQTVVAPAELQTPVSEAPSEYTTVEPPVQQAFEAAQAHVNVVPSAVQTAMPAVPVTAPASPKKSKTPIFIGIGIGVFVIGLIVALVLMLVLGGNKDDDKTGKDNETQTEQVDDNASSENNDEDDDKDNNDKDDKDDSGKGEDDKNTSSADGGTDKDDTPVDAVVNAPYTGYLDSFTGMFVGDLSGIGDLFPNAMWNMIRFALAEELGYTPSKDEAVEIMFEEAFAGAENEDVFVDKAEYTIISQDDVDAATIEKLQEGLCDYMVFDEIEEAYKVTFRIYMENDGESATAEDTAYAVYVDGEWTFMSVNYDLYMVDCTVDQVADGLIGENFI